MALEYFSTHKSTENWWNWFKHLRTWIHWWWWWWWSDYCYSKLSVNPFDSVDWFLRMFRFEWNYNFNNGFACHFCVGLLSRESAPKSFDFRLAFIHRIRWTIPYSEYAREFFPFLRIEFGICANRFQDFNFQLCTSAEKVKFPREKYDIFFQHRKALAPVTKWCGVFFFFFSTKQVSFTTCNLNAGNILHSQNQSTELLFWLAIIFITIPGAMWSIIISTEYFCIQMCVCMRNACMRNRHLHLNKRLNGMMQWQWQ